MGLLRTAIAAAILISVSWGIVKGAPAAGGGSDCSTRFQEAIQEVIQLKNTCRGGVRYKDCCQVWYLVLLLKILLDLHVGIQRMGQRYYPVATDVFRLCSFL